MNISQSQNAIRPRESTSSVRHTHIAYIQFDWHVSVAGLECASVRYGTDAFRCATGNTTVTVSLSFILSSGDLVAPRSCDYREMDKEKERKRG